VEVARTGFALPTPDEVEQLYALATSRPPQVEDADVAAVYAALYDLALDRADLVAVTAREVGELVGFGCGHRLALAGADRRVVPRPGRAAR